MKIQKKKNFMNFVSKNQIKIYYSQI